MRKKKSVKIPLKKTTMGKKKKKKKHTWQSDSHFVEYNAGSLQGSAQKNTGLTFQEPMKQFFLCKKFS